MKQGHETHGTGRRVSPWMFPAGLAAATAVVVLNIVAGLLMDATPWLLGVNLCVDLIALGVAILLVARFATRAETAVANVRDVLGATQARLSSIVESATDAIITIDETQRVVLFNRAAEVVFRCTREEALGHSLDRFLPARFRTAHHAHIERFGSTGVTSRRMGDVTTLWALRTDTGDEFPIEASISQVKEGDHHFFTVILRDITLRKQYEDALKRRQEELRSLSAQILEAREDEKTRIARELHDELGQLLTALKIDLVSVRDRIGGREPELGAMAEKMARTLDQTVTSVRRIAADLRPLMLDDLGLYDALSWLAEDFSQRSGVQCELQLTGEDRLNNLERTTANTVYRILQESLTNIARHAGAQNAWIVIGANEQDMRMEIEDDGRGIEAADLSKVRSLGLTGMRERVYNLGGTLEVGRAPRGGTRISVHLPFHAAAAGAAV
jgi:two-component system, NarL family, sensor histidine kinase UhpB